MPAPSPLTERDAFEHDFARSYDLPVERIAERRAGPHSYGPSDSLLSITLTWAWRGWQARALQGRADHPVQTLLLHPTLTARR